MGSPSSAALGAALGGIIGAKCDEVGRAVMLSPLSEPDQR